MFMSAVIFAAGVATAPPPSAATAPREPVNPGLAPVIRNYSGPLGGGGPTAGQRDAAERVYAVVGAHVLSGKVVEPGVVALKSTDASPFECLVRWSSSGRAAAAFSCSDGSTFQAPYSNSTDVSGSGRTVAGGIGVSLAYGMSPRSAARNLAPPMGYALKLDGERLVLTRS